MPELNSYPFYMDRWLRSQAVAAMTPEQRGVFHELLIYCWSEGSLPTEEAALQRLARCERREWARSWPIVSRQFTAVDGRLHNATVDECRPAVVEAKADRDAFHSAGGRARAAGAKRSNGGRFTRPPENQESTSIAGALLEPAAASSLPALLEHCWNQQATSSAPAGDQQATSTLTLTRTQTPSLSPPTPPPSPADDQQEPAPLEPEFTGPPGLETWPEFLVAVETAQLPASSEDLAVMKQRWRVMSFEQRLDAIGGLNDRIAVGQFGPDSDARYRPNAVNYLLQRQWERAARPRKGGVASAAEIIEIVERSLERRPCSD